MKQVIREKNSICIIPLNNKYDNTLIWLHGLGDSGEGYVDIFLDRELDFMGENSKIVLLNAKDQKVTINNGMSMPSWYDIK